MNKRKIIKITAITLVAAVAVGLLIARLRKRPATQLEDAKTVYMNAADAAMDIHDYVLKITQNHQITTKNDTFTENASILLSCEGFGSDEMKVCKEETLTIGEHQTTYSEVFSNDTLYTTINNSLFSNSIAPADYIQKIIPTVLLDYTLYSTFSGIDTGEEYMIHISGSNAPEKWAYHGDITFSQASGTAYISYAGRLTKSIYILEYTLADVSHRLTIVSELTEETPEVVIPENPEDYTKIQYSQGPFMLERASGFLTQMSNLRAVSKESTYFQAFGDTRTKTVTLETKNDIDWSANVETEITLSNESRAGQDSIFQQSEIFKLGVYQQEISGKPTAQNLDITEEEMQNYCSNILVSTILLPKNILQCQAETKDGVIRITYTANNALAQQISQNACDTLYQNPNLLTEISQKTITDEMIAYLEIDVNTGLPIASGIYYFSTYSSEDLPYQFRFQADQTYQILN